ncbi:MAG TPA: ornithine carbamoyltransferase, partial [Kiritimatiellia bacterium]|nr:ornithine carbamoyltransferase [Kiritimatiellia bacterium]
YVNCTPSDLLPDPDLVREAGEIARRHGAGVEVVTDPVRGVAGANVLYTDVWVSMGEEAQKEKRLRLLRPYQVNRALVRATGNEDGGLIFLHCLPAFHDHETTVTAESGALEVTDEVFEAPYSKVFDEAENRMHTIKALYVSALTDLSAL